MDPNSDSYVHEVPSSLSLLSKLYFNCVGVISLHELCSFVLIYLWIDRTYLDQSLLQFRQKYIQVLRAYIA